MNILNRTFVLFSFKIDFIPEKMLSQQYTFGGYHYEKEIQNYFTS